MEEIGYSPVIWYGEVSQVSRIHEKARFLWDKAMNSQRNIRCSSLRLWVLSATVIASCIVPEAGAQNSPGPPISASPQLPSPSRQPSTIQNNPQSTRPEITIPAGTILPVRLAALSSSKRKTGELIKATIMQDVPLANGATIRTGTRVLGHVADVTPATPGNKATLALVFDTVVQHGQSIPIVTNLRALASALEVESAQTPKTGPGESDVYDWLSTTQVGGDVVYGKWGQVTNGAGVVVGRSVNNGVLVQVSAKIGTACRGAIEGNDRPQALWVFSSDACGAYGFPHLTISHAGRTEPMGEIVLTSDEGPVKIRSGSGMLLRVEGRSHHLPR
jgi:hypothetical protein